MIIACLGVFEFIGVIPYIIARTTTSIYVTSNYSSMGLKFEHAGYERIVAEYFVWYKDKSGKNIGFCLMPVKFPIFIIYDPIKGNA